jgi:hypothetical protein
MNAVFSFFTSRAKQVETAHLNKQSSARDGTDTSSAPTESSDFPKNAGTHPTIGSKLFEALVTGGSTKSNAA